VVAGYGNCRWTWAPRRWSRTSPRKHLASAASADKAAASKDDGGLALHEAGLGHRDDGVQQNHVDAPQDDERPVTGSCCRVAEHLVQVHVNTSQDSLASTRRMPPQCTSVFQPLQRERFLCQNRTHCLRAGPAVSWRVAEPKTKHEDYICDRCAACCKGRPFTRNVTAIICSHSLVGEMREDSVADRRR
jgi:hypothetical protein